MILGYARVSTEEQNLDAQVAELTAAGCERVFSEKASGSRIEGRPVLAAVLTMLRPYDVLWVTKLDRLARNTLDMLGLVQRIGAQAAGFRSLAEPWADTTSPAGTLMLTVMAGIAQFERGRMLERQREGIERAKAEGKYQGRPQSFDPTAILALKAEGLGATAIARKLGCGRATVYRALGETP